MKTKTFIVVLAIFLLAVLRFLLKDFANFAPIAAICIIAAYHFGKSKWTIILPIAALLLSDFILEVQTGTGLYWGRAFDYLAFLAVIGLAWMVFKRSKHVLTIPLTAILGSLAFFFISNTGVWIMDGGNMYADTFAGLQKCLAMGIPFFRGTIAGDMFFTTTFFALYEIFYLSKGSIAHSSMSKA